jgi:hypothetical protein
MEKAIGVLALTMVMVLAPTSSNAQQAGGGYCWYCDSTAGCALSNWILEGSKECETDWHVWPYGCWELGECETYHQWPPQASTESPEAVGFAQADMVPIIVCRPPGEKRHQAVATPLRTGSTPTTGGMGQTP